MRAFVLATGPSLTQEQVDAVRGRGIVVAVSNAYKLAPWADALVSTDSCWWANHPAAMQFAGRRFAATDKTPGVERFPEVPRDINSGLLATQVAVWLGATTVLLLGVDMQGSHYFGPHPLPLTNSSPDTFRAMMRAFARYQPEGVKILNCSPTSALECYPKARVEEWL